MRLKSFRIVGLLTTLSASVGLADADPPKPRVMVILDTSRSMTEKPKFYSPTDIDITIPMSDPGGDYNSATDPVCTNKFCTAKKVIHEVIPQYTEDARIGLSTYFQYVMRATTPSTENMTCSYDVLAPANELRQFTSVIDFTGGGLTTCPAGPSGPCGSYTQAMSFPDAWGGSGGLYSYCNTPSDYARVSDPTITGDTCTSANCYQLTKTAASAGTPISCTTYKKPSTIALNTTYSSPCSVSARYTQVSTTTPPAVVTFNRGVALTTTTCAGTVVTPSTTPTATPTWTRTSAPTVCSPWSTDCTSTALKCSSSLQCDLFLGSSTPTIVNSARGWYGLFDPAVFTPAGTVTSGSPTYAFSTNTGATTYVPGILTGTVTGVAAATPCYSGLVTTGATNTNFGISNAATTLGANTTVQIVSPKVDQTPTKTSTNYNCTSAWPCYVTLTSDTPTGGTWTTGPVIYNTTGLDTSTWRVSGGPTTNTYTAHATSPSVVSCAALATTVSPTAAPTNMTWDTATPTGCGTAANYVCTFSAGTSGSATAGTGVCNAVTTYVAGAPANCSYNGKAYGAPSTSTVSGISKTIPASSSCTTGTFTTSSSSDGYTGVPAYPASLTYSGSVAGTPESSAVVVDVTAVPSGYSGSPATSLDRGTSTFGPKSASTANLCVDSSGSVGDGNIGDSIQSSDASLCGTGFTPCTLVIKGMKQTSASGCGSENAPCYQCEYQPRQFQWQRPTTQCNYSATRYVYSVDRTTLTCSYTRQQWNTQQTTPATHTCAYSMGALRYDFSQPSQAFCSYWTVQTNIESPRNLYTYQYLTKGTEVIGRATKSMSGNYCSTSWTTSNAFGSACPETVACSTLTSATSQLTMAGPAELAASTCRLQYGGSSSSTATGPNNGRYSALASSSGNFDPVATTSSRACEASTSLPASPDSYKSASASPAGFCSSTGSPAVDTYSLVSDWYDPTLTNSITSWSATYPSPATLSWSNTSNKAQGFSAAMGTATTGSGVLPPRSVFVPIPNDSSYSASSQKTALEKAVDRCVLPGDDGGTPNVDGSLQGGACISNAFNPSAPGYVSATNVQWKDMTPLYGSLESTKEYLTDRWQNDDDAQDCRDYFIVLATDGLESTPKGYTLTGSDPSTSVEALVGSFRNTSNVIPKTKPDIKTFVIGFGEGAAGAGGLDAVAAAGGTSHAFSATSLSELEAALQAVFTTITQGTFSRSKPALGTDGKRLYAAQYVKPSIGADWSGLLTAYRVSDVDGSFSLAWEWSQKLNSTVAQPTRDIAIGLRKLSDNDKTVQNFASGGEVSDQLSHRWDWPGTFSTGDLIDFLREAGHSYESGATRTSAAGPIVMSNPIVVSKSPFDIDYGGPSTTDKSEFSTFVSSTASRGTRVMFTSNDGMVHSLVEGSTDADCTSLGEADEGCPNGSESWAFIPGSLQLGYTIAHGRPSLAETLFKLKGGAWGLSLLDNSLSIADVCDDGSGYADSCHASDWRTIAIGSQRGGGRGMFAIDVTNNAKPNTSRFLWDFFDGDVGFTYSVPAVGRARHGGHDQFVAVFGGGFDDPGSSGFFETEGLNVFVVNALTGDTIEKFSTYQVGGLEWFFSEQAVARPATFRRPGTAYIDTAFAPVGHAVYALRFAEPDGDQQNVSHKWKPDELFDPLSWRNTELATCPTAPCGTAKVNKVVETVAGTSTTPPVYALQYVQDLPLSSAPSIHNRPKVSAQLVPSGSNADFYVGTGDIRNPQHPDTEFAHENYFYAVHDFNQQNHSLKNDGKALWVVQFPQDVDGRPEEIVSEPAIISGCVVVATYKPPLGSAGCALVGDTTLYGFNPVDGSLKQCLVYTAPSNYAGSNTSVVKMGGVGVPSDLVVVNDNVYFASSKDGLQKAPVKPSPQAGEVRSYRRVR